MIQAIYRKCNRITILFFAITISVSCSKYLDTKADLSLNEPQNFTDVENLLDNVSFMNAGNAYIEGATDDYYLTDVGYNASTTDAKQLYIWGNDYYPASGAWTTPYITILYANTAIQVLNKLNWRNSEIGNYLYGRALFYRSWARWDAVNLFTLPYDSSTASRQLGIDLRESPDINIITQRASLEDSYNRIIGDLEGAISLLPTTDIYKTRPTRGAAYGLLSRIYLSLLDYPKAFRSADSALKDNGFVDNYNNYSAASNTPFNINTMREIVFFHRISGIMSSTRSLVDTSLYGLYENSDIRKSIFFRAQADGTLIFKGNYTGGSTYFDGISTDELLLTRAECNARMGKNEEAINDLNSLLQNRYKTGAFVPIITSNHNLLIDKILEERRKELLFRGIRWSDLRRLNKSGYQIAVKRSVNGQEYILEPNDLRYAYLIPLSVIAISGIEQNMR